MMEGSGLQTLASGLVFPESPRWHGGRLWVSDWGAQQIVSVDPSGRSEVALQVQFPSFPMCMDWLPDGRLLVVSASEGLILRQERDGTRATHADIRWIDEHRWNEIVVDGHGNAYVNNIGFDFPGGEFAPGIVAMVTPGGSARKAADGLAFPNGMIVTPDNSTLIVAESYANRLTAFDIEADGSLSNRRVWADLPGDHPDGICLDAEGAVWYADVANKHCVRVREGGEVLQTIAADRGCFACALGGTDGRTLFMVTNQWGESENAADRSPKGQVLATRVPVPSAH